MQKNSKYLFGFNMSTNQQPVVPTNLTPNNITELLFNNMILSKLTSVMDKKFVISFENIVKLILLMSIGEIKNGTTVVLNSFINQIKKTPSFAISLSTTLISYINQKKVKNINREIILSNDHQSLVKINIEKNFMDCLYAYMVRNVDGNCKFNKMINAVNIKNAKERIYDEIFTDIEIKLGDVLIKFPERIEFSTNRHSKQLEGYKMPNKFNHYSDMLQKDIREIIVKIYNYFVKNGGIDSIMKTYITPYMKNTQTFSELTLANLISEKYKFDTDRTLIEISILASLLYGYAPESRAKIAHLEIKSMMEKGYCNNVIFDIGPTYKIDNPQNKSVSHTFMLNSFYSKVISEALSGAGITVTVEIQQHLINFGKSPNNPEIQEKSMNILITSQNMFDSFEVTERFIETIISLTKKTTKKIDIYSITIKITVTKNIIDNPEFIEWQQQFQQPKSSINSNPDDNKNKGESDGKTIDFPKLDFIPNMMPMFSQPPPPRKITDEKITKELIATKLNSMEKSIDTLYLRQRDINKLITCLHQFKDKKDLLESLGFQNKLNILLYGMPGTGKSTTITAIATYMQRDIYYVDLKEAKTNKDLQLIFDYVNKNVKGGGIIVFEDIDSMTNVVLKRRDPKDMTVSELAAIGDKELTLEYLLNILQGTLTIDDSIIIVTTNHINHLDPAFYRDGRFDVKIELKLCDRYQIDMIYQRILGRKLTDELLDKIPEDKYTPASIIFHIKDYIFNPDATDEEIMQEFITN